MVQCGEHIALLLTVYKRVAILHRNKRREIVCNSIIYGFSHQQHAQTLRVGYSLCMAWTNPKVSELVARRLTRSQALTLPSVATAHAIVSDVSRFHNVVQSLHGLIDQRIGIEAMALQDVDIIMLQTLKRFTESEICCDEMSQKRMDAETRVCTLRLRPC